PGGEVTLQDSAGIAGGLPSAGASSCFDPGRLAEAATRRGLDTADLLLAVVDATDAPLETLALLRPLLAGRSSIVVLNKIDAAPADEVHALSCEFLREETFLRVSARTGRGLETLRKRIAQALFAGVESHGSELLALSSRQLAGLRDARAALARSADLLEKSTILSSSIELLALEIREAMNALSLLVGEVATEELLGRIFSRFCIGK
ncbi:MAG: tRNA modification GTPase MnmE, partial [Phycisphaerae bacterium]